MTSTNIRQKLHDYIRVAEDRKLRAIYTMLEDEIETYDYWNDKAFVSELNKRSADYKNGKVKAVPWKKAKEQILNTANSKKRNGL
ncbi:MAG: hypothetical protein ACR2FN_08960 [Chitinophagaceae bacterium]